MNSSIRSHSLNFVIPEIGFPYQDPLEIMIHRAGSPENTLQAIKEAVRNKHPIEIDYVRTKDGAVVFHDPTLTNASQEDKKLEEISTREDKYQRSSKAKAFYSRIYRSFISY